jgi:hypothetical protein
MFSAFEILLSMLPWADVSWALKWFGLRFRLTLSFFHHLGVFFEVLLEMRKLSSALNLILSLFRCFST